MEPLRKIIARVSGHFIEGKAVDIIWSERLVEVETDVAGEKRNVYLPYATCYYTYHSMYV